MGQSLKHIQGLHITSKNQHGQALMKVNFTVFLYSLYTAHEN